MAFTLSLGNLEVHLIGDNSHLAKTLRGAEVLMEKTQRSMEKIGKTLSKYVTLPLSIMGAASVKAFANFDDAMTQSLAIMGNVSDGLRKEMEDVAKTISSNSIKSAEELGRSYFYLASAGLDVYQSMAALPVVTSFATAGMFDMSYATDLLTDAQSALGMTVKDSEQNMINMTRISDVLVKANVLANASVEQFSTALTTKAGTAMKAYNISLEEGVSVLAAYADQGIKAENAGEMFGRMIRLLIKGINDNTQAWEDNNIQTQTAEGNLLPLADIIEQIHDKTKNLGAVQKAAALEMLGFEARSQQAILPLLGLSDNLRKYEEQLRSAGGMTEEVSKKQLQSFSSEMKILWNNIKLVGIEIGRILAPSISILGGWLKSLTMWFRMLNPATQEAIVFFSVFAATLGPVILAMSKIIALSKFMLIAFTGFGPAVIAVTLLAGAVLLLVDAFTDADLFVKNFFDNIRIGNTSIGARLKITASLIVQTWDYVTSKASIYWQSFWGGLKEGGAIAWRFILEIGKSVDLAFWTTIKSVQKGIVSMMRTSANALSRMRGVSQKTVDSILNAAAAMEEKASKGTANIAKYYDDAIAQSLSNSYETTKEYYDKIEQLDKDYAEQAAEWANYREEIFFQDAYKNATNPDANPNIKMAEETAARMKAIEEGITDQMDVEAQKQIEIARQKNELILQGTSDWLNFGAQLMQLGGKKQFKVYKAFAMAEASIAAYMAYNKILASTAYLGPGISQALASAQLALGLLRVRQIAMMQPGGSGSGGGGGGAGVSSISASSSEESTDKEEAKIPDRYTIIIENVHGTADERFADMLAEKIADRSGDGREYGFETVSR